MSTRTHGHAPHEIQRAEAETQELAANAFKVTMFGVVGFLAVTWFVMM